MSQTYYTREQLPDGSEIFRPLTRTPPDPRQPKVTPRDIKELRRYRNKRGESIQITKVGCPAPATGVYIYTLIRVGNNESIWGCSANSAEVLAEIINDAKISTAEAFSGWVCNGD